MAVAAGQRGDPRWGDKALALRGAIQKHFWDARKHTFRYLADRWGGCDRQEGLGNSLALLFGVAEADQVADVLENQVVTEAGIACVWPTYPRYESADGMRFGRHSGAVWPHVQALWAEAAARAGSVERFAHEFDRLTGHITRDAQCAEIYHPLTGAIYGGVQEGGGGVDGLQWESCRRQSWSASGYLRMLWLGMAGMRFSPEGLSFQPLLPPAVEELTIQGLIYRGCRLNIHLRGAGNRLVEFKRNGISGRAFLPTDATGKQTLEMRVDF
jgi:glycogen debranching enzyme